MACARAHTQLCCVVCRSSYVCDWCLSCLDRYWLDLLIRVKWSGWTYLLLVIFIWHFTLIFYECLSDDDDYYHTHDDFRNILFFFFFLLIWRTKSSYLNRDNWLIFRPCLLDMVSLSGFHEQWGEPIGARLKWIRQHTRWSIRNKKSSMRLTHKIQR